MPPVSLERPTLADRELVYSWMTMPGIVERMMGPPTFPEIPVPSYHQFCADYGAHWWTHSEPNAGRFYLVETDGRRVGCIAHNEPIISLAGVLAVEIDLWLAGPDKLGRGLGRAAIRLMCELVKADLRAEEAFLQPSARNLLACAAYSGAGFHPSSLTGAEAAIHYRTSLDYRDSIFFARRLS